MEGIGQVNRGYGPIGFGEKAGQSTVAVRQSAAGEIMEMADKLVAFSGELSERTEGKLSSICRSSEPRKESEQVPIRNLPPYFDALRDKFDRIERNLNSIDQTIERAEL